MSVDNLLQELSDSNNSKVANWAKDVLELKLSYETKRISESEYKELMQDLVHSKNISDSADDLAVKTKINECIENIISVVGIVG
jgi:hypothetical protein